MPSSLSLNLPVPPADSRLCVGIDTVLVSGVRDSLAAFGERFELRLFTAHERAVSHSGDADPAERLAARFAAKEAAIKAFGLSEVGIDWRQIEVHRAGDGRPTLRLHGRAAEHVRSLGATDTALSLSHDGDQACAVVVALAAAHPSHFNELLTTS